MISSKKTLTEHNDYSGQAAANTLVTLYKIRGKLCNTVDDETFTKPYAHMMMVGNQVAHGLQYPFHRYTSFLPKKKTII